MRSLSEVRHAPTSSGNTAQLLWEKYRAQLLGFLLLHILLAVVLTYFRQFVNIHVVLTLGYGITIAALKAPLSRVAAVVAYIVGAEVLWRMTGATFFWEGGKYAVSLIMLLALFRTRSTHLPTGPLFYFLLLIPSILITLDTMNLSDARAQISFNLSGPFTLFISMWFFSQVTLKRTDLLVLLMSALAPIIAIAARLLINLLQQDQIVWIRSSNFAASAGFGPNQVSTILGLGVLLISIILVVGLYQRGALQSLLILLSLWLLVQALLTFSRGGVIVGIAATVFLLFHTSLSKRGFGLLLVGVVSLYGLVEFVLPSLNEFTAGMLEQRYSDLDLTGRDQLMQQEWRLFLENPIAGVGPGGIRAHRVIAAHAEYTRMVAEHGLLGLMSLLLLILMLVLAYLKKPILLVKGRV